MGNRACVIFHDKLHVSPTVYLHWDAEAVPAWLEELRARMQGRFGDASYAVARFVGICHTHIDGNLSLGVLPNGFSKADLQSRQSMEAYSPGNGGTVVVDTVSFNWKAYGGFLSQTDAHRCKQHHDSAFSEERFINDKNEGA